MFLANQQKDGDSPVRMIVPGLLEKSRCKQWTGSGCCSRQSCGSEDWRSGERNEVQESGKAKVHDRLPGSRSGRADELTLRTHEEGVLRTFMDTTNVKNEKMVSAAV